MIRDLFDRTIEAWGPSKVIQCVILMFAGAGVFGVIGSIAIPNIPMIVEKENDES